MENRKPLKLLLMEKGVNGTEAAKLCGMTRGNFYRLYFNATAPTCGHGWPVVERIMKHRFEIIYNRQDGWHFQTELEKAEELQIYKTQVNAMFGKEILK